MRQQKILIGLRDTLFRRLASDEDALTAARGNDWGGFSGDAIGYSAGCWLFVGSHVNEQEVRAG